MINRLLLVSCGEIGSRHLQALTRLKYPLEINVVESYSPSIDKALIRFKEAVGNRQDIILNWFNSIDEIVVVPDLVISASNSKNRAASLIQLAEKGCRKFLVEKMVCQSSLEYELVLKTFKKYGVYARVNLNRRYFPLIRKIKDLIGDDVISMSVNAGNIGLGCNAIHYLDYFKFLIGHSIYWTECSALNSPLEPNRRGTDYVELSGSFLISSERGDRLFIDFNRSFDYLPALVINSNRYKIFIDEQSGKAVFKELNKETAWFEDKFEFVYQSVLTDKYILDIENNTCLLPTIEESFEEHKVLFDIFLKHINRVQGSELTLCPVT